MTNRIEQNGEPATSEIVLFTNDGFSSSAASALDGGIATIIVDRK